MLFCEKCGAYSPDNSRFCIQCGNKFSIEDPNKKDISLNEIVEKLQNEGYTIVNDENKTKPDSVERECVKHKNSMETQKSIQDIPTSKTIAVQQHTGIKKVAIETKQNKKIKPKKEKLSKEDKKAKKNEIKEAKKISKEVLMTTKELLDFVDIDDNDRIVTKTGIIDLFQIQTKDIYSFSPTDRNLHIFNFVHFIRGFVDDFKIITMKFPVSTKLQQDNIKKKISKTSNEIYKNFLNEKLEELEFLEENRYNKEFYLMTFYKLNDDIEQKEKKIGTITSNGVNLCRMSVDKKIRILHKLNNMNSKLF